MQRHLLLLLISLTPLISKAQKVKGIIYDDETTVKGAKVLNITKKTTTHTDANGEFEITATINDTLYFQSLFHHPKYVTVSPNYFESTYVFELKKITNQLDVVKLSNNPKEKVFEEEAFNKNLDEILEHDKKNNPAKYNRVPKYGADIIQLIGMIGKLFKKKKNPEVETLTYNQIKTLFDTNAFFNQKLLAEDLKIPNDLQSLFFEFCEEKICVKSIH